MLLTREQRNLRALDLFGVALGLVLLEKGWAVVAKPGVFHLERNGESLQPAVLVHELAAGNITADEWARRAAELGVADCSLAQTA